MTQVSVDLEIKVENTSHYESSVKVFVAIIDGLLKDCTRQTEIDCLKNILIPLIKSVCERTWFSDEVKQQVREDIIRELGLHDNEIYYLHDLNKEMERYVRSCPDKTSAKRAVIQSAIDLLD